MGGWGGESTETTYKSVRTPRTFVHRTQDNSGRAVPDTPPPPPTDKVDLNFLGKQQRPDIESVIRSAHISMDLTGCLWEKNSVSN